MLRPSISRYIAAIITLTVVSTVPVLGQQGASTPTLMSLVESERSFARTSREKGLRASFLEYFAANCVSFAPEPGNARERLLKRPAPATLPPTVLDWHPIYADVSQAGDMGYTTGPSTFVDNGPTHRPTYYGFYFSVWKKQTDGSWKVVLDIGTETPEASAMPLRDFEPAPTIQLKLKKRHNPADGWAEIVKREAEFSKLASSQGSKTAYLKYRAANVRLNRDGHFPIVGAELDNCYLWEQPTFTTSKATFVEAARSGDLAYVYGSYELKNAAGAVAETGYYARVWRRNAGGEWKLAADITNPQPAAK